MVTDKAKPPVCKIADYGKYLYNLQKKQRTQQVSRTGEIKGIRLTFNISEHDLQTRIMQAERFLKKGYKVRVEMKLKGREKKLTDFSHAKVKKFLEELGKKIPIKTESELRKRGRGLTIMIFKDIEKHENEKDNN